MEADIFKIILIITVIAYFIKKSQTKEECPQNKDLSLREVQEMREESFKKAFENSKNNPTDFSFFYNLFNVTKVILILLWRVFIFALFLFCLYSILANIIHFNIGLAVAWTFGAIISFFIFMFSIQ